MIFLKIFIVRFRFCFGTSFSSTWMLVNIYLKILICWFSNVCGTLAALKPPLLSREIISQLSTHYLTYNIVSGYVSWLWSIYVVQYEMWQCFYCEPNCLRCLCVSVEMFFQEKSFYYYLSIGYIGTTQFGMTCVSYHYNIDLLITIHIIVFYIYIP